MLEHTIIFENQISNKTVQNLINNINSYQFVNLYFSTNGGRVDSMKILVDFLNHRYAENSIKIILFNELVSAGTYMLIDYHGPLFIKDLRYFMFHAPDIRLNTIRNDAYDKKIKEMLDQHNEIYYEDIASLGLTKAEIKKIKEGGDIYIYQEDFSRIKRQLFLGEENIINYQVLVKPSK